MYCEKCGTMLLSLVDRRTECPSCGSQVCLFGVVRETSKTYDNQAPGCRVRAFPALHAGPPTSRQLHYARRLGIALPADATLLDVSELITKRERELGKAVAEPTEKQLRYSEDLGIPEPRQFGRRTLSMLIDHRKGAQPG